MKRLSFLLVILCIAIIVYQDYRIRELIRDLDKMDKRKAAISIDRTIHLDWESVADSNRSMLGY